MDTVEERMYSYRVRARDYDSGDKLEYRLHRAPAGMAIDVESGIISWVPNPSQAGINPVEIQVSDGRGGFAGQSYAVQVYAREDGITSRSLADISDW
jgi:hypothetical protein